MKGWDALKEKFTQSVETVTKNNRVFSHSGDVDTVDLAENIEEYRVLGKNTPIVRASVGKFASDVIEPGYRVEGDDEQAVEYLMETWLPQAAIIAGEKHNDFLPFLKLTVEERWNAGGGLIEHVKDDPESESYQITGVNLIKPETVEVQTLENKNILASPDDTDLDGAVMTPRGEVAAYIQFHEDAIAGPFKGKDEVPLSQNDVTRTILNPDIGGTWGTPVTETVAEDVKGFKEILRDQETAIKTKAYGLWSIAFGRDVVETPEFVEVIEWSDDEMNDFVDDEIDGMGPGEIISHDGEIELEKFEPDVPDLIDHLEFYVNNITTALPSPKYIVGFESDINQFVTERQDERYERLIREERQALERDFSALLQDVVERNLGIEDPDVELVLEPEPDDSPVMSLDETDVEKVNQFAQAVDFLSGSMDPEMLVDNETLLTQVLQLPEDAVAELEEQGLDESDPQVQEQVNELEEQVADS